MAVYTQLDKNAIARIIAPYQLGELVEVQEIAEGVENSNYLIYTSIEGAVTPYIFTIFEKRMHVDELPFFMQLMRHLAHKAIPCPLPLQRVDGDFLSDIEGKKAAITTFLHGQSLQHYDCTHLTQLGRYCARLHGAAQDAPLSRANDLSLEGWHRLADDMAGHIDEIGQGLHARIKEEWHFLSECWPQNLPQGIIHADLFPNNVFFVEDELSGIIDFYFACHDILAYELAICINAWCFDAKHQLDESLVAALLSGYHQVRPLSSAELTALPILCRGAALRFFLTRSYDWLHHPKDALVTPHNPLEYWDILTLHQQGQRAGEYALTRALNSLSCHT